MAGIGKPNGADYLWYVAKGVQRLATWSQGQRIIWNCVECTRIGNETGKPTPHQVRAEAWMALIHGSTGLIWFVHQFKPTFDEHALLDDPEMLAAVTGINRQIRQLAPVLNSPTVKGAAAVTSDQKTVPIDAMAKQYGGATYLFAVGMRNAPARGAFRLTHVDRGASVEVLGEGRRLPIHAGELRRMPSPHTPCTSTGFDSLQPPPWILTVVRRLFGHAGHGSDTYRTRHRMESLWSSTAPRGTIGSGRRPS